MEPLNASKNSPIWKGVQILSFIPVPWIVLTILQGIAFFVIWLCFVHHASWISYIFGFGILGLVQKANVWVPSILFAILCPFHSATVRWICCWLAVFYVVAGGLGYLSMDGDMTGMGRWMALGYIVWMAFSLVKITIIMGERNGSR